MSNIARLEFAPLDVSGKNYMPWVLDVKMHLESMGISDTIKENFESYPMDKAKACIFLRRHIDDGLKFEYLTIDDPYILWKDLKERFDNQKEVLLPSVREEWRSLRFQDFKKVNDYSSAMFKICSQLKFCGQIITDADMLEKTYTTFHASNITLQQQLRLQKFTRYSELNSYLLVAEQNNELLMKNHQSRPTGSSALPEANTINRYGSKSSMRGRGRGRERGRGHFGQNHPYAQNNNFGRNQNFSRGQYYGRGRGRGRGRTNYNNASQNKRFQPQRNFKMTNHSAEASTSRNHEDSCFRCGVKGHWYKNCRTPQHLCELYKESLKGKEKEVNLMNDLEFTNTEMNATDFCSNLNFLD